MIPRVAKRSGGTQPQTPLRPYGVMPTTTGKRPAAGVLPSRDGKAIVAASWTPSSIGMSTSLETLLYVGSGSFGGGDAAFAGAAHAAASATPAKSLASTPASVAARR